MSDALEKSRLLSIYDITVPVLSRALGNLATVLDKGRSHAEAAGIAPADLLATRLFDDMFPLTKQVQRASDTAKFTIVRVTGVENVRFDDTEASFDELQERIAKTRAFIAGVPASAFAEPLDVTMKLGGREVLMAPADYVLQFGLPNFMFHVVTAYDLLRHRGVPIGKQDFLGPFTGKTDS